MSKYLICYEVKYNFLKMCSFRINLRVHINDPKHSDPTWGLFIHSPALAPSPLPVYPTVTIILTGHRIPRGNETWAFSMCHYSILEEMI